MIIGEAERLHSPIRLFDGRAATSWVGIVIGVARFGTVPDAMIVIVLQLVTGLALNAAEKVVEV